MERSRIRIDRDTCIGSGNCAMSLPSVFDQDDQGVAALLDSVREPVQEALIRGVVQRCPSGAITVLERDSQP